MLKQVIGSIESEFDIKPEWAHGALLLVPVTAKEVADAGLHLRVHHIVALPEDREHIKHSQQSGARNVRAHLGASVIIDICCIL